jgi:uncharacterized protein YjiS (DUF1127 family)
MSNSTTFPIVFSITDGLSHIFDRRRTLRALEALDDRLLRDVGLTRSDLDTLRRRR